jgi:Zn-dependent peptidase ImmA (M78 family)
MPVNRAALMQAILAADRLHKQFDTKAHTQKGDGRIDVFKMFVDLDIPMLFRPLNGLLGAYLADPNPGVMITTKRQLPIQRFTAGHELGHAVLKHQPSLDDEEAIFRSVELSTSDYDVQEMQANAFASQLLMPRWLIAEHMERQQWTPQAIGTPETIYQLSLRLGTSFAAACYALYSNKVINKATYKRVSLVNPKAIKQPLVAPYEPANWYGDVWLITERDDGLLLEGSRSDLVIISFAEHAGSGYIWRLDDLVDAGLVIVQDRRSSEGDDDLIGGVVSRKVVTESQKGAKGSVSLREVRPWQVAGKALHSVNLDLDLNGPVTPGLLPAQREAALGAI